MMVKSLILGNSNSWIHLLCIANIFDLVSFSELGFSDKNMSAAYTTFTGNLYQLRL